MFFSLLFQKLGFGQKTDEVNTDLVFHLRIGIRVAAAVSITPGMGLGLNIEDRDGADERVKSCRPVHKFRFDYGQFAGAPAAEHPICVKIRHNCCSFFESWL
jgi:hypothetical protein